MRKNRDILEGR